MWLNFAVLLAQEAQEGVESVGEKAESSGIILIKENFEGAIGILASFGALLFEAVAVGCVFIALAVVFRNAFKLMIRRSHGQGSDFPFIQIRTNLGSWLGLALEFQLASDILGTVVAPSFEQLGKLAIVAVIRTFLNFFLNKELAHLQAHHDDVTHI